MTAARKVLIPCAALVFGLAGCRVHVDKDANGQEKTVQVETPLFWNVRLTVTTCPVSIVVGRLLATSCASSVGLKVWAVMKFS